MKLHLKYIPILLFILGSLYSCSISKYIPEDERLYTGAKLKIESDSIIKYEDRLKAELETVMLPEPNSKILGINLGLYYYYKNQKENPGFINRWLYKKLGQKPVYQSAVKTFDVEELLVNRLENRGFFYSTATSKFKETEKKSGGHLHR